MECKEKGSTDATDFPPISRMFDYSFAFFASSAVFIQILTEKTHNS